MQKRPIDHQYQQSYLLKAGVRFDFNVVDTVCARKLGMSFYLALLGALILFGVPYGMPGNPVHYENAVIHEGTAASLGISPSTRLLLMSLMFLLMGYALLYVARYCYYLRLRAKLRTDRAPIAVEAYAVVCLDLKVKFSDYLLGIMSKLLGQGDHGLCKYAVIYKEIGTENPRFFITAAVSARKLCFIPEHIGRVFIHRKKNYLYTLDDSSAYQTVSVKRSVLGRFALSNSASLSSSNNSSSQSSLQCPNLHNK